MANGKDDDGGALMRRVPVPDPTLLTTEALLREIKGLRELMELKIEGVSENLDARWEQSRSDHLSMKMLTDEKFKRIDSQLDLVENQRKEQKADTKTAVDAALSAQKEAVHEQTLASDKAISKSEQGTTKQIDQLATNFDTAIKGQATQVDDLKERMTRVETAQVTKTEQRQENRSSVGVWVAGISAVVFFLGFVVALIALIYKP